MTICHYTISTPKPIYKLPTIRPYPVEPITLGDYLRKKRLDLDLKQEDVAKILKVDISTIAIWERNEHKPSLEYIPRIICFIGYCPYDVKLPISEKLNIWRSYNGIPQKKMAKLIGVDPSTLGRWERGKRTPSRKQQKSISLAATKFGVRYNSVG